MRVDPEPMPMTLAELRQEQDGLLVSQHKAEILEDAEKWVYRGWDMLFTKFLNE